MTPYLRALRWHDALRSDWSFDQVIYAHGYVPTGHVIVTPEVFVMARRVSSGWPAGAFDELSSWDPAGDCWHVWLLAGDPRAALKFLPYELPWISYHRRGKLRVLSLEAARRMLRP